MNLTNFKLIYRNLLKHTGITAINIFGLSISLSICLLIVLFLRFEYSFDKSNPNHEALARLVTTFKYPNSPERDMALAAISMGPYLERESQDIEQYLRVITNNENFLLRANGSERAIEKNILVDSTFFSFFNYPLLYGDPETVFEHLDNIVITKSVSEALFGESNPIGQLIDYTYGIGESRDTTIHYKVTGVFDDLPANSHLQFETLRPLDERPYTYNRSKGNLWHAIVANTYFRLRSQTKDLKQVAATFPELLKKEMPGSEMVGLSLQSFDDIHLGSNYLEADGDNFQKSDRKYLNILGLVALFILMISSINFANLSTVLAMRRVQEVGVRKSLGASSGNVLLQFLGEALLMALVSGLLAVFWMELLRSPFLSIIGREVDLVFDPLMIVGYVGVIVFLGIIAGIFPASQAASYSPVQAFNRKGTSVSVKRPFVRRLVIAQFMLSGMLIIGSLICYQQLNFLQNKDLGFQYDQVIELSLGYTNGAKGLAMKKEMEAIPGVIKVSGSDASLGAIAGQNGMLIRDEKTLKTENYPMSINRVDDDFFDLYEMKFVEGRAPRKEAVTEENEFVVNESFVKKVGWKENPIGKEIWRATAEGGEEGRVVGVIKDIHHNNLRFEITPVVFQTSDYFRFLSLKVNAANAQQVLTQAQQVWDKHIKDKAFEYRFMDERFAQLYHSESRLSRLLLIATVLSILIACLGLLALSSFIIQQRTKEIGVRKVLGATTTQIVGLLSKDFLTLVFIAFLLASPVAWYFMNGWLENFAYRIHIPIWIFLLAGIAAMLVAFLTVSLQSVRAASANPVKSLRNE